MADLPSTAEPTEESSARQSGEGRRKTYLQITFGKLHEPSGSAKEDGESLVQQCLRSPEGGSSSRFPPRVFVLWLTAAFARRYASYRPLLGAIQEELKVRKLESVPLIGASVAICLFDDAAHEEGALMICLASRFIEVKPAIGLDAQNDPAGGVKQILHELELVENLDPNPRRNRFLLTFLPGYGPDGAPSSYRAPEIIAELNERTCGRVHMFGGVSSAGLKPGQGSQFLNGEEHTGAAVVAMVTSYLTYGIGFSQGLVGTGSFLHVTKLANDGRTIEEFQEGLASEVMRGFKEPWILGVEPIPGERAILLPSVDGDTVKVQRPIGKEATLEVLGPDEPGMRRALGEIKDWVLNTFRITPDRFVAQLVVGCTSRYREREKIGMDLAESFRQLRARFPELLSLGCSMDGEVGIDRLDRLVFGNWSLAELSLVDDLYPTYHLSLAFDALVKYAQKVTTANSIEQTIDLALECIEEAGFCGGMISLVLKQEDRLWIVAQKGCGGVWDEVVKPLTRRELDGDDVLALVANSQHSQYIRDATTDKSCDQKAALAGGITSFYAFPLLDEANKTIGILQIDLGDLRRVDALLDEQKMALKALGTMTAVALNRAIRTEELELSRNLSKVLQECLECGSEREAARRFVKQVLHFLKAEGHVRLVDPSTGELVLAGGSGASYRAARCSRKRVDPGDDSSQTSRAFRGRRTIVVNDPTMAPSEKSQLEHDGSPDLQASLARMSSCASFPVAVADKEPMGVVCINSPKEWFFSQSLLRSLDDIGGRLAFLLMHIRQKRQQLRDIRVLSLLRPIQPALDERLDLYAAMLEQARRMKREVQAEEVSCFLWDEVQERFVLRAQVGWKDERWVGVAFYRPGDGLTGELAACMESEQGVACNHLKCHQPAHVADLFAYRPRNGSPSCRYVEAMFGGQPSPGFTFEVIALPLVFKGQSLGIVTMHRRRSLRKARAGFAMMTEPEILEDAAKTLSAYVAALKNHEFTAWRSEELKRLDAVGNQLHSQVDRTLKSLLQTTCDAIVREYKVRWAAIYLEDPTLRSPFLHAHCARGTSSDQLPDWVEGDDPLVECALREKRTFEKKRPLTSRPDDRAEVRGEGRVERVCLPLIVEERCLGVLDMQWRGTRPRADSQVLPHHSKEYLEELAKRVAVAISTYELRRGVQESSRREVETLRSEARARRSLGGMAYYLNTILHSLRNDVQSIQSGLNIVQKTFRRSAPSVFEQCITTVEKLRQRLEFVKDQGHLLARMNAAPCRVFDLLTEVISAKREQSVDVSLKLRCDAAQTRNLEILLDREQMRECFSYLIDNAINAFPREHEGPLIEVSLAHPPKSAECQITIRDNGPGLNQEDFQTFLRGEHSKRASGTGMGIFMAGLFCKNHGGKLELDESGGSGTKLKVTLRLEDHQ